MQPPTTLLNVYTQPLFSNNRIFLDYTIRVEKQTNA